MAGATESAAPMVAASEAGRGGRRARHGLIDSASGELRCRRDRDTATSGKRSGSTRRQAGDTDPDRGRAESPWHTGLAGPFVLARMPDGDEVASAVSW